MSTTLLADEMVADNGAIWLTTVVPAVGSVLGCILGFAAVPQMLQDRKDGRLSKDPVPYPVAFITCFSWCLYGATIRDPWPLVGNILPVLSTAFCTVTALGYCRDPKMAARAEKLMISGIAILLGLILFSVSNVVFDDLAVRGEIAGFVCTGLCIMQFSSPCVAAITAVRKWDASKLSLPLAVADTLCAFFWTVYGTTAGLHAMWVPNSIGFVLSFSVCLVKICIGRHPHARALEGLPPSPREMLLAAANSGNKVVLRSLGPACKADPQLGGRKSSLKGGPTTFEWTPCPAGDGLVALKPGADDAYLCVCLRSASDAPVLGVETPTDYVIKAVRRSAPGDAGCFLPVHARKTEVQDGAQHVYAEDSVALYNRYYKVFLRLNSSGEFDCSNPVNECGGAVRLPGGWLWERFAVSPPGPHSTTAAPVKPTAGLPSAAGREPRDPARVPKASLVQTGKSDEIEPSAWSSQEAGLDSV